MAEDFCFRVESLITAVQKRQILYNKKHRDYNNKDDKEQAWIEVCADILPQWLEYGEAERNSKLFQVQRKWRNLRDSFRKDLNIRRDLKPNKSAKKKREYIYYRSMLFLEPYIRRDEVQNRTSKQEEETEYDEDDQDPQEDTQEADVMKFESEESQYTDTSVPFRRKKKFKPTSYEEQPPVLELWEGSLNGDVNEDTSLFLNSEIDEDRYFLLSLLPSFKGLTPQQKLSVKVEFLQVLQKISFSTSQDPLNESTT